MKRIKAFCITLLFVCIVCVPCSAQIICTDVNPDAVNSGNFTQDIDLNNDLTPDFRITSAQSGILSFALVQGSQIGTGNYVLTTAANAAAALPLNTPINLSSTTWAQMNSTNQIMIQVINSVASGNWAGAVDQYLGLRLVVGTNTYYGWARFTFSNNSNTYTFKDYAYESSPGQSILAGQGCGSISSPAFSLPPGLCIGSSHTLIANTGTATASTYSWSVTPSGPTLSAASSASTAISFSTTGIYTVSLAVTAGTLSGSSSSTVQINALPSLSVSPANTTICQGGTVKLTAAGTATSFAWTPTVGLSAGTGQTVQATPSGTQIYTLTGSLNGCSVSVQASLTVVVPSTFAIWLSSYSLCASPVNSSPSSITLTVAATSNYTFSMLSSAVFTAVNTTNSLITLNTIPPYQVNSGQHSFTVQGSDGICTILIPAISISVSANPVVSSSNQSPVICEGKNFTMTAMGASSYSWSSSLPGSFTNPINSVAVLNPSVTATYSVVGSAQGCNSATKISTLTVLPLPQLGVTHPVICVGQTVALVVNGANSYAWTGPSGFVSTGGTVHILTPFSATGIYVFTVTGTAANNCTAQATSTVTVDNCTRLSETENNFHLRVYPNPTHEHLFIEGLEEGRGGIEIINGLGQVVVSLPDFKIEESTFSVDLQELPAGVYLIRIRFNNNEQLRKFIKQ